MINVVDRVPTYPNRVKITHSDGTSEYVTWERADEPTVPGTPINKALFDSIVEDIGLNKATTVYVSTAGSDTLGDGTAANPYATINKVVKSLPRNLNGYDVTINIASGAYEEDVYIARMYGGVVVLKGEDGASVSVRSIRIEYGSIVHVEGIKLTVTGSYNGVAVAVTNANFICFTDTIINASADTGVAVGRNGFFCAYAGLTINNTLNAAISISNRSAVFAGAILGEAASGTFLVSLNGSLIAYNTMNASAPVLFHTGFGGRIYSGAQTNIPNY